MRPDDLIHFCPPGRLIIGCGSRSQLPALLDRLGHRRGVLVTDEIWQVPVWVEIPVGTDLRDPTLAERAFGHYSVACTPCHGAPGVDAAPWLLLNPPA